MKHPTLQDIQVFEDGEVYDHGRRLEPEFSKTGVAYVWVRMPSGHMVKTPIPKMMRDCFASEERKTWTAKYREVRPVSLGWDNVELTPRKPSEHNPLKDLEKRLQGLLQLEGELRRKAMHEVLDKWLDELE